jgi:PGF-CTERM protein
VRNAPPALDRPLVAPSFDEDTVDASLDLSTAAKDPDGDPLVWALKTAPEHLSVTIAPATGVVTLRPDPNWFGTLMLTFTTSDGEFGLSVTVNVTVLSVNDLPWFVSINGGPVGQAVQVAAKEGEQMVVTVVADDVEGDALTFGLDTTDMVFDPATGEIRWTPKNEDVGERHVRLTVHDAVSPDSNVTLDVTIVVANANNPPADPRITEPLFGFKAKVNETFNLSATCSDPDEMHGQALTYSWSSNASGLLGQGQRLPVKLNVPGLHIITLTVSDGEFTKTAKISVTIEALPPVTPVKPTDGERKKKSPGFEALAAVTVLLTVAALARRSVDHRRR